jgi:hypothetical protein
MSEERKENKNYILEKTLVHVVSTVYLVEPNPTDWTDPGSCEAEACAKINEMDTINRRIKYRVCDAMQ